MKVKLKETLREYKLLSNKEYEVVDISEEGYFVIYNEDGEKSYYPQYKFIVTSL